MVKYRIYLVTNLNILLVITMSVNVPEVIVLGNCIFTKLLL